MEQHSLLEETATRSTLDTEDAEREDTPTPQPQPSQHEHSDSMVTIRLSKTDDEDVKKEELKIDTSVSEEGTVPQAPQEGQVGEAADEAQVEVEREASLPAAGEEAATAEAALPTVEEEPAGSTTELPQPTTDSVDAETASIRSSVGALPADTTQPATLGSELERAASRARSMSSSSSKSSGSGTVNWTQLDKTEEEEEREHGADESTAFLLARLEQENNAIATDPKAQLSRGRSGSRPPSFQQLKKLVSEPQNSPLRYSMLPAPPPMTELEFWSALVRNYHQTAQRLPTLTSNKIRSGIPPPLRGVVWQSIAGARDAALEEEYLRLSLETSPHEKLILKDIGRSFPGVDMFRDPDGEGQKMLGKVLSAFSLYDPEIGYCQGLGFVVGPLLMHMGDKEAFCTLVRLIMHYDLRSCFLPDLSGLHLRIYQFQHLLSEHLPALTAHLDKMAIEPLYLSQWFLSFFGVTCPLPMLIRIYDVILTEGASETLMRVALSLMRRNEKKILCAVELEDVMQLLLSRGLWDTYGCNADDLVQDFCSWTGLVTREKLQSLEENFRNNTSPTTTSKPSVHTAAARFLGRFWAGSAGLVLSPKSPTAMSLAAPGRPASTVRRTPSKQSMASTLNSIEGSESSTGTEATEMSRQPSGDWVPQKPSHTATQSVKISPNKDKGLHSQIEDLLTALSDLQREHSQLASELQREREERDEDRLAVKTAIEKLKSDGGLEKIPESQTESEADAAPPEPAPLAELEERFSSNTKRTSLMYQSKQQLRDDANRWRERYNQEALRTADLTRQLGDQEREINTAREDVRDARARIQATDREKQRLEKTNQELRSRSRRNTMSDSESTASPAEAAQPAASFMSGLREFKLGRASTTIPKVDSNTPQASPVFSKRVSSLSTQSVLATEDHKPATEDALLVELVAAKTAEAVAKQELEEVKSKLESLRKLLSGSATSPGTKGDRTSPPPAASAKEKPAQTPGTAAAMAGSFFSGWGKRVASSSG